MGAAAAAAADDDDGESDVDEGQIVKVYLNVLCIVHDDITEPEVI